MQDFFLNMAYLLGIVTSWLVVAAAMFFWVQIFADLIRNFAMFIGRDIPENVDELHEEFRKKLLETK